ncbi:ANR family transcriptional regulator [Klebsiella aerogenes]|uniref:ANR family transcriptional regulator n=1 Tax=Klebsiella aerogenes TaxID=548 RepID=UPI0013A67600|nr:ANR family transcriptional regulator [Klebsiella aerogenes]HCB2859872.1 ANR family transcriptional regulator [Klebsiella aerogenes]HCB2864875.1 ANR family transcriptional regulator [Klebsiella aerogenes]HCB2881520.1 ANR family transcriptional regulator [Klebsiella aerogenes]HCB3346378.1 ANR family transcriptional regulator [Klebsiella aerogenes]HCM1811940.1 ANR family transcriptional regulator [Klebsiella aerogenes]
MSLYSLRFISQETIMATCNHHQHRQLAREAAWLEIRGDYARATLLWQRVSREAPKPQWQAFASRRATLCRSRQPLRSL